MTPASQQASLDITRGDAFSLGVTLTDGATLTGYELIATDPLNGTLTILGEHATVFPSGKLFRVSGNRAFVANAVYTSAGASESGGNTIITLPAVTTRSVTAVDTLLDSWTIAGDRRQEFPPGAAFYATGNTGNTAANKLYTVQSASYNGTSTIIVAVEDIPSGASVTGSLFVPAVSPLATATGEVRRTVDGAVDIDDYTIEAQIRNGRGASSTLVASFTVAVTDAAAGEFTVSLSEATTAGLDLGAFLWDARLDDGSGTQYRIPSDGAGGVRIRDGVTQT